MRKNRTKNPKTVTTTILIVDFKRRELIRTKGLNYLGKEIESWLKPKKSKRHKSKEPDNNEPA